jgi:hypothetical protein
VVALTIVAAVLLAVSTAGAEPGLDGATKLATPPQNGLIPYEYSAISCPVLGGCVVVGPDGLLDFGVLPGSALEQLAVTTQTSGTWGKPATIPAPTGGAATSSYASELPAVSCPDDGDCVAVGSYATTKGGAYGPITVSETSGTWGGASYIPQPAGAAVGGNERDQLEAVTCASAGNCVAVGVADGTDGLSHAYVDTDTAGAWGVATMLPVIPGLGQTQLQIAGVVCSSLDDCRFAASGGTASYVWTETAGTWSGPVDVSTPKGVFAASSIACPSATTCLLVGFESIVHGPQPAYATESDGTWSTASTLPIPRLSPVFSSGRFTGISCSSATECVAVGLWDADAPSESILPGAATWSAGSWSSVGYLDVPTPKARESLSLAESVSCPSTTSCVSLVNALSFDLASIRGEQLAVRVASVRAVVAPGSPTRIGAVGVRSGLTATWLPPANDGGSPIDDFTATLQPGDRHCTTSGDACTVRGLVDGHRYRVIVRDRTAHGTSRPTVELAVAGPVPTRPRVVRARDVNGVVEISWRRASAPPDEHVHYVVTLKGPHKRVRRLATASLRCQVGGLPTGRYTVAVVAFDASGHSVASPTALVRVGT